MTPAEVGAGVRNLLADYGWLLDEGHYGQWLELFAENTRYRVIPRENWQQNLPACLIQCDSKDMLRDRIAALVEANKFNIHTGRHVIGLPRSRIEPGPAEPGDNLQGDVVRIEAPFSVYQSDQEGEARLFSVGVYLAGAAIESGQIRLTEMTVVVDNFAIPSLLAVPL